MSLLQALGILCMLSSAFAQRKFYSLQNMPETNFDCRDKILGGYYADPEANCQMFHVCVKIPGQGVQDFRFLCPNETSFDQENQICADSGDIDCEASGLYVENFDLYRIGSAPAKKPLFTSSKGTVLPLGPSTKSPLLTNNINEDDELFLQRSDTGDRRLHSKDLLRGSSSSNFFNGRNKGKDLDEDEDDEPTRTNNDNTQQYRPKGQPQNRGKSQYSSHFRRTEAPTQPPTPQTTPSTTTTQEVEQVEKKRTKIAVRKLARKRPVDTTNAQTTPNYSSFTTQVTQKFNFGEQQRYNTINRSPVTNGATQRQTSSTLAFFEPNPTPRTTDDQNQTPFSLNKQPIVAAAPSYQQNRQNFQQGRPTTPENNNFRQSTPQGQNSRASSPNNQNRPQTTQQVSQTPQQNRLTTPAYNTNFQQHRPQAQTNNQGRSQAPTSNQNFQQAPANNQNFQQRTQAPVNNQNFQQQQRTPAPANNQNFQQQQQRTTAPANNQNFQQQQQQQQRTTAPANNQNFQQQQRTTAPANNQNFQQQRTTAPANNQNFQQQRTTAPVNNQNFQQRSQVSVNNQNYQQQQQQSPVPHQQPRHSSPNPQTTPQIRETTVQPNTRAQTINNALQQSTIPAGTPRQYFNRNFDDFEDQDQQEFLKTAPSNNFRPSDLNSFQNNYKKDNFEKNSTTTKYYTPTIITTPKPYSTRSPSDFQTTSQQFTGTNPPSPTTRFHHVPSSTLEPPTSGPQPRPFSTTPNKPATSSSSAPSKDASYDYAYYDDAGVFSEYDALDALGESDFSRTSQRQKSRLI